MLIKSSSHLDSYMLLVEVGKSDGVVDSVFGIIVLFLKCEKKPMVLKQISENKGNRVFVTMKNVIFFRGL